MPMGSTSGTGDPLQRGCTARDVTGVEKSVRGLCVRNSFGNRTLGRLKSASFLLGCYLTAGLVAKLLPARHL